MKKLITLIFLIFLIGCNPITTGITTTTSDLTTTQPTSNLTTQSTVINDEIYLYIIGGQDTVEINTTWIDMGAYIVINEIEYPMTTEMTVNTNQINIYQIIYTYVYQEITYQITRYVAVLDQTPPVIELNPGIDTVYLGNAWIDAGASVTDNSNEILAVIVSGEVDIFSIGTYQITYTATDSSNNTISIIRYVNVVE